MKLLLCTVGVLALAEIARTCSEIPIKKPYQHLKDPVLACSRLLSCLIEKLCSERYLVKRDTSLLIGRLVPEQLVRRARRRRGLRARRLVVDECCEKACTVEDILDYCPVTAPPPLAA